jgi:hypothetical protein
LKNKPLANQINDCSLRVARATGVFDKLTTRNVPDYFGASVPHNPNRLQVVRWEGHMGVVKDGFLYHMQVSGYQPLRELSGFNNYMGTTATYYNILR